MDTNSILLMVQDKLPKDIQSQQLLRDNLDKLNDTQRDELVQKLPLLKLKSPSLVFWVGSFLFGGFGVGRFMIGDMLLGGLRLGLWVVYVVLSTIGTVDMVESRELSITYIISLVLAIVMFVWWIVDLFLTGKKLRANNLNKILQAI